MIIVKPILAIVSSPIGVLITLLIRYKTLTNQAMKAII